MRPFAVFSRWHQRWLKRRIPPSRYHTLDRKNIFIFPNKTGFAFLLTVCLLWLLGTNYQNNLVIMLAFLLISLMHTCIFYTYQNFSGLCIELRSIENGFCGDFSQVTLLLKGKHPHHNILMQWNDSEPVSVSLEKNCSQMITLCLPLNDRGWLVPGRLTLATQYPLGLLISWTHIDFGIRILSYPKPIKTILPDKQWTVIESDNSEQVVNRSISDMVDDIAHLREYQKGDVARDIAWKTFAKGQGPAKKVYESMTAVEKQQWFDWDRFSGFSIEERLSRLCYCVLQEEKNNYFYGLKLPGLILPLGSGAAHQTNLLQALALYNKDTGEGTEP